MDPQYKPLYQRIDKLHYDMHDALDDHNHPMAHAMRNEVRSLMDDIETNKNPRDLEHKMKIIEHQLLQLRSNGQGVMSYDHSDHFRRNFEEMRMDVRKFHNY